MKFIALALLGSASAAVLETKAKWDAALTGVKVQATGATATTKAAMHTTADKMKAINVDPAKAANIWWGLTVKDKTACGTTVSTIGGA